MGRWEGGEAGWWGEKWGKVDFRPGLQVPVNVPCHCAGRRDVCEGVAKTLYS